MNRSGAWIAVVATGLLFTLGCSEDSAQPAEPGSVDVSTDVGTNASDAGTVETGTDASTDPIGPAKDTAEDTAMAPVGAGLTTQTLAHDGVTRTYLQYIPAGWTGQPPAPVMLNFHGNGGDAEGHLAWTDMRTLADTHGFILIYPQGLLLNGDTHWNPILPSAENKSDADDFGFVGALLDALGASYTIDADRVYATGYSNGAGLAYGLACYLSDRVAAVAPVSGSMYVEMAGNCAASHPTAIAIFNGTNDNIRPYDGFPGWLLPVEDAVDWWVDYNGITAAPTVDSFPTNGVTVERHSYTGGDAGVGVTLFKVIGGDHVWFDINVEGVNTSALVWSFVSRYAKSGLR